MTTSEIVKRLRSFTKGNDALEHEAADRLEELDRALDTAKAHIADLEPEVTRLREALGWFLDDERFRVAVGGNPNVVEKMLEAARAALRGTET
jgi:hypothetical protein